jgi:hypothetical protein
MELLFSVNVYMSISICIDLCCAVQFKVGKQGGAHPRIQQPEPCTRKDQPLANIVTLGGTAALGESWSEPVLRQSEIGKKNFMHHKKRCLACVRWVHCMNSQALL